MSKSRFNALSRAKCISKLAQKNILPSPSISLHTPTIPQNFLSVNPILLSKFRILPLTHFKSTPAFSPSNFTFSVILPGRPPQPQPPQARLSPAGPRPSIRRRLTAPAHRSAAPHSASPSAPCRQREISPLPEPSVPSQRHKAPQSSLLLEPLPHTSS